MFWNKILHINPNHIFCLIISRHAEDPGWEILKCPPSVCLSVTYSFRTVTRKRIGVFFSKLYRYVHHVMGVCCTVFDIDGMLFDFLWIFEFVFSFHVFLAFYAISNIFWKKNPWGGEGNFFVFTKTILSHFILRFMLFPTFKKKWVFFGVVQLKVVSPDNR